MGLVGSSLSYFLYSKLSLNSLVVFVMYIYFYIFNIVSLFVLVPSPLLVLKSIRTYTLSILLQSKNTVPYIIVMLNLLGIPPFGGFVLKIAILSVLLLKTEISIVFFFLIYSFITVLFYLQFFKSLKRAPLTHQELLSISKSIVKSDFNYYVNIFIYVFSFVSIFFIFFFKDFFLIINLV